MLSELCHELNNWFDKERIIGDVTIEDGKVTDSLFLSKIQPNQYFRIVGSIFNDGVWKYGEANNLVNEVFNGAVWLLAIPQEVVNLSNDIDTWKSKYMTLDSPAMSPFTSESFGGYAYSKNASSESGISWQSNFKSQLNKWRKI